MIKLAELTRGEFRDRMQNYDFLIGEKESCSKFYEFYYNTNQDRLSVCIIHNYPNMDLDPQIAVSDNRLIIGNNESLTIINLDTRDRKDYPVFPVFYKFFLYKKAIVVLSELVVFCILEDKILWEIDNFYDMICFERLEGNKLVVSTYENRKEISIDMNTGKII